MNPTRSPSARAARIQAAADRASRRAERDADWRSYEAENTHARNAYHRRMAHLEQLVREDRRVKRATKTSRS